MLRNALLRRASYFWYDGHRTSELSRTRTFGRSSNCEPPRQSRRLDVLGAGLVTLGMTALTYGIVTTERLGWGALGTLAPLAAGVVLLAAFTAYEGSVAKDPLIPLRVFRLRTLR